MGKKAAGTISMPARDAAGSCSPHDLHGTPGMHGSDVREQGLDLTCVVVTSPTWANPALGLLPAVLASFGRVRGLDTCRGGVLIVLDGYVVAHKEQTKRGRVTQEMADNYERYHTALLETYTAPRYRVVRCPEHVGFAHAVKVPPLPRPARSRCMPARPPHACTHCPVVPRPQAAGAGGAAL